MPGSVSAWRFDYLVNRRQADEIVTAQPRCQVHWFDSAHMLLATHPKLPSRRSIKFASPWTNERLQSGKRKSITCDVIEFDGIAVILRMTPIASLRAKRSNPSRRAREGWIASSLRSRNDGKSEMLTKAPHLSTTPRKSPPVTVAGRANQPGLLGLCRAVRRCTAATILRALIDHPQRR